MPRASSRSPPSQFLVITAGLVKRRMAPRCMVGRGVFTHHWALVHVQEGAYTVSSTVAVVHAVTASGGGRQST